MPLFSARALHKQYAAGVPGCCAIARILSGIDLELGPGDLVGIVGARASGKTTLVRCVAGIARPDAGALHWAETARRPRIVSVSAPAYPFETVEDVLERACSEPDVEPARLEFLLGALALTGLSDRAQFALTLCERARMALAVGMAAARPLLLLDGTPDVVSAAQRPSVRALLMAYAAEGRAVLVVGRDEEGVAGLAATVLRLSGGRLRSEPEREQAHRARVAEGVGGRGPSSAGRRV